MSSSTDKMVEMSSNKQLLHAHAQTFMAATGLGWIEAIQLALQFGGKYGPELIAIATQVGVAVKGGNVLAVAALIEKYGPDIETMAQELAKMFGITLPSLPPVTT